MLEKGSQMPQSPSPRLGEGFRVRAGLNAESKCFRSTETSLRASIRLYYRSFWILARVDPMRNSVLKHPLRVESEQSTNCPVPRSTLNHHEHLTAKGADHERQYGAPGADCAPIA
jgi:hypothetical protein